MAKCTKNVRIMGKYRNQHGTSLWKVMKHTNQRAYQVYLLLLWQNQDEEMDCGSLALWFLHENSGWWCLDLQHHFCGHSQVCHQKTKGIERAVKVLPFETSLAYNKMS
jgi:hypothetical protein